MKEYPFEGSCHGSSVEVWLWIKEYCKHCKKDLLFHVHDHRLRETSRDSVLCHQKSHHFMNEHTHNNQLRSTPKDWKWVTTWTYDEDAIIDLLYIPKIYICLASIQSIRLNVGIKFRHPHIYEPGGHFTYYLSTRTSLNTEIQYRPMQALAIKRHHHQSPCIQCIEKSDPPERICVVRRLLQFSTTQVLSLITSESPPSP